MAKNTRFVTQCFLTRPCIFGVFLPFWLICKCARYWPATVEEDDLIEVREAGLEVRLRDFDDQDNDFSVRKFDLFLKL